MNRLTYFKRSTLALIIVLISVNLWGQSLTLLYPDLPNSETNPYLINSAADWGKLVYDVNVDYYSYTGKYIKLNADIVIEGVEYMVGTDDSGFSGTFDGNNHTLTINYNGTFGIAPFYDTTKAIIQDLIVEGDITAYSGDAAGLIYKNFEATTISNVTVSVNITATNQHKCAGFAVSNDKYNEPGLLTFNNCVYNGKIVAGTGSGGFWASTSIEDPCGTATFNNCLFDPAEGSVIEGGKTFGTGTDFSSCYYTDELGMTAQGTRVYKERPSDIVIPANINGVDFYMPVDVKITGVAQTYNANGTDYMSTIMACSITFDGVTKLLSESSDNYDVAILGNGETVTQIVTSGDYTIRITGKGDYSGTYYKVFYVLGGELTLQDPESPYSTTNPYLITSTADWLKLAKNISDGVDENYYADKYYKLTNNIIIPVFDDNSILSMIGTSAHPFSGHFDGATGVGYNINTLTFNYGTSESPTEEQIIAPFRYTDGATIQNLWVSGAIHTNVGKEAGLIGVNTHTSANTTVYRVIVDMNFYCYEELWDEEGGGFAYNGSGITFTSCAYQGTISAENYHGGFCGNANSTTTFADCLFNPAEGGIYWAENFVWNNSGAKITSTCYYTEGNNQEESEQGKMVYVVYAEHPLPDEVIGKKLTTLYGRGIYEPVNVVISGVNKRYTYTGEIITVEPSAITFNDVNALTSSYCSWSITPSPVREKGLYKFTVTAPKAGVESDYLGSMTQLVRVVESSSIGWTGLQAKLSGSESTIELDEDITAGEDDPCLIVEGTRNVTIYLNGHTINRGFYNATLDVWTDTVVGGHVLKIGKNAIVTIYGNNATNPTAKSGKITGGSNKASSTVEHAENSDGGGIFNMGTLTLINVTVEHNYCEKRSAGVSRTARGGGIYSGKDSKLTINGGKISHNRAQGGGGGLFCEKAKIFEMDNVEISSNISLDKGGGIRVDAYGTKHNSTAKSEVTGAMIKDCQIKTNQVELHNSLSASNGGGIHIDDGTVYVEGGSIDGNFASKYGGGIYIMKGTAHVKDCLIINNSSYDWESLFEGYGGGVCILGGTYYMEGGTVSNNFSYVEDGGGIFVAAGKSLHLKGNVNITNNWKYDASYNKTSTTNVHLAGSSDVIYIDAGFDSGSLVGICKHGVGSNAPGKFTSGLTTHGGTIDNFISDDEEWQVLPASGEAKLGTPAVMPDEVNDGNLPTGITKDDDGNYVISVPFTVSTTVTIARPVLFSGDGCIIITDTGLLYVPNITNETASKLIIENGGQIVFTGTPGDIRARTKKDIQRGYDFGANWYLISSAVNTPTINRTDPEDITNTNLVTAREGNIPAYDFYRFNEAATAEDDHHLLLQWENYRASHADFASLTNGRGYLYRNFYPYTIAMEGNLNVASSVTYGLTYTVSEKNKLTGFNLIGNPYPHNIYKNDKAQTGENLPAINDANLAVGYYVLYHDEDNGDRWDATIGYNNPIKTGEGILVQTTSAHTLTITNTTNAAAEYPEPVSGDKRNSGYENIMFEVANNRMSDVAYAMFSEGIGLNKIAHMNEDNPVLYIRQNDQDYAIATMGDDTEAFSLNFEAKTTGMYTLSVQPQGDYRYLHLYDKLTGKDVDLLLDNEYSFVGSTTDAVDRFTIVLNPSTLADSENEIFAYQSGNEIIVNGKGELQIFDVMGRMVATKHVNGVQAIEKPSTTGVYIMKLNGMTQKIVIK